MAPAIGLSVRYLLALYDAATLADRDAVGGRTSSARSALARSATKAPEVYAMRSRFYHVLVASLLLFATCVVGARAQTPPATPTDTPLPSSPPSAPRVVDPQRKPFPVVLDGRELFKIRSPIGPYSIEERAALTERRLRALAAEQADYSAIATKDVANRTDVVLKDRVITSVFDADAEEIGKPRQAVAAEYARAIREALEVHREERRASSLALGTGLALLYTLILVALLRLLNLVSSAVRLGLLRKIAQFDRDKRRTGVVIPTPVRLAGVILRTVEWARAAVVIVVLYAYLTLVFGQFPWTRGYAQTLLGYVTARLGALWTAFLAQVPNLVTIVVIVFIAWLLLKLVGILFHEVERGAIPIPGFDPEWANTTFKILRFVGILLTIAACYPYVPGSQSPALQGVSVFFGLLISLGSSSAVANTIAGILMTYMRPFRVGDRVRIGATEGNIIEKSLLVTRVRTVKNLEITIPNSLLLNEHIVNFSARARHQDLILHTTVTIGYDVPWRKVHELLREAALRTENVLAEPEPFVLQTALNDFSISYQVNVYTDRADGIAQTLSTLHANIQDAFNEANVEILSPTYHSLRDGNESTVPADYRPADYRPGGFRVESHRPHTEPGTANPPG